MSNDQTRKTLKLNREATPATSSIEERLHKVLAQAGLGSRRALEERISRGEVRVNGEVAELGRTVKGGDRIELDGKTFMATALTEPASVLLYNKPEGVVTTREDPEGRPTVFEALPRLKGARWIAVGRLDINTTGLLLLTTDGELANALMHPSNEVEREYVCRIHGEVPENIIHRFKNGVTLEDGPAKFDEIERIGSSDSHAWFRIVIKEGRNREVRRMWDSQGFQVSRLKRVRYGKITLPRELLRSQSIEMSAEQVEAMRRDFGLENQPPVLTLQSVIGQRRGKTQTIEVRSEQRGPSYVNGAVDSEARELRRFDHVREERPARGRGKPGGARPYGKKVGGKPFVGPMGSDAPAESRGPRAPKPFGKKPYAKRTGEGQGGAERAPSSKPYGERTPGASKPYGERGPSAPKPYGERGPSAPKPYGERGPSAPKPYGERGPSAPKPYGERGPSAPKPYGERGPSAPKPYGARPARGPRVETGGVDSASGAFRSWYVPEGVDTGSKVAPPRKERSGPYAKPAGEGAYSRGPRPEGGGPARGPRGPGGSGPAGSRGPGGGGGNAGPRGPGGGNAGSRGPSGGGGNAGPRGPGGPGGAPRGGQRKPGRGGQGPRLPEGMPDID